jgi:beta-lactamase class A
MTVADDVAAILTPLGGRTAFAARLFRPGATAPARRADEDDHDAAPYPDADLQIALNADEVFPAASLAKLPIAVEFLRRVDLGQFDLAERWDTSSATRAGGSGVLESLDPTTQLTLGELCTLMLIVSDNTAANVLLDLVGMGEVNESLNRMGLKRTKLARRFMDFEARAARRDNLTSAGDLLTLLTLVQKNMLPGARWLRETLGAQQQFVELAEGWLPPTARLAHKDGLLPDAAHDAGIVSGPRGSCAYDMLTAEQTDIPAARYAIGRVVRLLWDAWLDDTTASS